MCQTNGAMDLRTEALSTGVPQQPAEACSSQGYAKGLMIERWKSSVQAHHHFLWQLAECVVALHEERDLSPQARSHPGWLRR